MRRNRNKGVTLIELMIVMVVAAILVGIAYPGYQQFVQRARRTDATISLNRIAAQMEKFFAQCSSYTENLAALSGPCTNFTTASTQTSTDANYTIAATPPPLRTIATGFVLTATPVAGKPQANDSRCAAFTLASTGFQDATNSGGSNSKAECWKK